MTTSHQAALLPVTDVSARTESVYYATDMCNIKIGRTTSPKRRGGQLKVDMLLTIEGGELEERRQQRMWRRYRIGTSEWFRADPELLLWLTQFVEPNTYASAVLSRLIFTIMGRGSAAA